MAHPEVEQQPQPQHEAAAAEMNINSNSAQLKPTETATQPPQSTAAPASDPHECQSSIAEHGHAADASVVADATSLPQQREAASEPEQRKLGSEINAGETLRLSNREAASMSHHATTLTNDNEEGIVFILDDKENSQKPPEEANVLNKHPQHSAHQSEQNAENATEAAHTESTESNTPAPIRPNSQVYESRIQKSRTSPAAAVGANATPNANVNLLQLSSDLWDDQALIQAWNCKVSEYRTEHGIQHSNSKITQRQSLTHPKKRNRTQQNHQQQQQQQHRDSFAATSNPNRTKQSKHNHSAPIAEQSAPRSVLHQTADMASSSANQSAPDCNSAQPAPGLSATSTPNPQLENQSQSPMQMQIQNHHQHHQEQLPTRPSALVEQQQQQQYEARHLMSDSASHSPAALTQALNPIQHSERIATAHTHVEQQQQQQQQQQQAAFATSSTPTQLHVQPTSQRSEAIRLPPVVRAQEAQANRPQTIPNGPHTTHVHQGQGQPLPCRAAAPPVGAEAPGPTRSPALDSAQTLAPASAQSLVHSFLPSGEDTDLSALLMSFYNVGYQMAEYKHKQELKKHAEAAAAALAQAALAAANSNSQH